jgi:hypothetical protein
MNKNKKIKYFGMAYFLLDIIIQGLLLCGVDDYIKILSDSLFNALMLYCCMIVIFAESKFVAWLAFIGLLLMLGLVILFIIKFFRNKKCFLIPLCLTGGSALLHIILCTSEISGLLYNIIGCILYAFLVYGEYGKKRKEKSDNA